MDVHANKMKHKIILLFAAIILTSSFALAQDIFLIEKNIGSFIYENSSKELLYSPLFIGEHFLMSTHLATYNYQSELAFVSVMEYNSSELLQELWKPFLNLTNREGDDFLDFHYESKNEISIIKLNYEGYHSLFVVNDSLLAIDSDSNINFSDLEDAYIEKFTTFQSPDKDKNKYIDTIEVLEEISSWVSGNSDFSRLFYVIRLWRNSGIFILSAVLKHPLQGFLMSVLY